ncbi:unnamed protein product [Heterobilharzia americana]|nr:unnamed protein product [Heterobilharzia americana]
MLSNGKTISSVFSRPENLSLGDRSAPPLPLCPSFRAFLRMSLVAKLDRNDEIKQLCSTPLLVSNDVEKWVYAFSQPELLRCMAFSMSTNVSEAPLFNRDF